MSYIGNQVTTTAFLTDQFSGNGSTVAFTMSAAPATTSSIIVAVTGVLQDPSTYAVSGTTLTFSAAPPTGTGNISVRYLGIPASGVATTAYRTVTEFTATAGQTTFNVPSYTVGYIDVYRNGVRLGAADFTATTGTTVVLASAASLGDLVTTESFYVSSVLNAIPATAGAVNSTYIAAGAIGSTQIAAGGVTQSKLATGVAGNGPSFNAYSSTYSQSVSNTTWTKVTLNTEIWDTDNCFDTSLSRFTPNVAGYYQITGYVRWNAASNASRCITGIWKNGAEWGRPFEMNVNSTLLSSTEQLGGSWMVYLNGTTDYVELYGYVNGSGAIVFLNDGNTAYASSFQGFLARAA